MARSEETTTFLSALTFDVVSSINITRRIDATPHVVWEAWTDARILEKWWAPKPYKAETRDFDFRPGGHWYYAMAGKDETHWAAMNYGNIDAPRSFEATSYFINESSLRRTDLPETIWRVEFRESGAGTLLDVTVTGSEPGALEKLLEMGFEEGFKTALDNLDRHLNSTVLLG